MRNKGETEIRVMIIVVLAVLLVAGIYLFRPQSLAKNWGGNTTIDLDPGVKLEEITWKDNSLWYLTRPMREGEEAEIYTFKQSSNFGLIEGTVKIVEHQKESKSSK